MTSTALITGISNGIGLGLVKIHAEKGENLALVARSEDKLLALTEALSSKHSVRVDIIAIDLSQADAAKQVFEQTEQLQLTMDLLVNNACFGGEGKFH